MPYNYCLYVTVSDLYDVLKKNYDYYYYYDYRYINNKGLIGN